MAERYRRLFALSQRQYAQGAPVLIEAGALLKDNQAGAVLAQLKFSSISSKAIKAITVAVAPLDTAGQPLGEAVEHQYLDLNIRRDQSFGQKEGVPLPDPATRGMTAAVTKAVFADNSIWESDGEVWEPLPTPETLEQALGDAELAKQYRLELGAMCHHDYQEIKDLWLCPCGAVNHKGETCHSCGKDAEVFATADLTALRVDMEERLEALLEEQRKQEFQASEKMIQDAKQKNAVLKIIMIAIWVAVAVSAVILLVSLLFAPKENKQPVFVPAPSANSVFLVPRNGLPLD